MKSNHPRVRRPVPERTRPNRAWSGMFGAGASPGNGSSSNGPSDGAPPGPSGAVPGGEAVRRGVDLGYRVIDEYLKQGQAFARTMAGPGFSLSDGQDLAQMTSRMFKYASDFASVWLEAMGLVMANGAAGAAPGGQPAPASNSQAAPAPAPLRVALEISARGKARAAIEIGSREAPAALAVPVVRRQDGDGAGARLSGISVTQAEGGPLVKIAVPARQTPGVYQGPLVDARSNLPVGKLTVWVEG